MGQTSRDHDDAIELFGENSHFDRVSINGMPFVCEVTGSREVDGRKVEDLRVYLDPGKGKIDPDYDEACTRPPTKAEHPLMEAEKPDAEADLRHAVFIFEENPGIDRLTIHGVDHRCEVVSTRIMPSVIREKPWKTKVLAHETLKVTSGLLERRGDRRRRAKYADVRGVLESVLDDGCPVHVFQNDPREIDGRPALKTVVRRHLSGEGKGDQDEARAIIRSVLDSGDELVVFQHRVQKDKDGIEYHPNVVIQFVGTAKDAARKAA